MESTKKLAKILTGLFSSKTTQNVEAKFTSFELASFEMAAFCMANCSFLAIFLTFWYHPFQKINENEIQKYYKKDINIISKREKDVKGIHTVFYKSPYDEIEITHSAKNRDTFARGAIMSAEWLVGKKGFYTFNDCLKNEK